MLDFNGYQSRITNICQKFSVLRLDVVGSASRDDFDPQKSDLDFLIQFEGKENLFNRYFELKFELEKLFGRKVDLIQEQAIINPYINQSIQHDRKIIYAA
ncbi:MAG: nucleotidyltransferase domain-containing protein [SAR324 cluster bacterium]|nr:nucleotidyltransferase domain-containing protein [SAR324 cluster bacterium]